MRDFVYKKPKITVQKRIRILENRDLIRGIRLNRNERVENFDRKILPKIFNSVKDYELGKYPDQSNIYKLLSKYLKLREENFLITSGIDGSIKSIFEIFTDKDNKVAVLSPTYAMYEVYGKIFQTKIIKICYKNFKLDKEQFYKTIKKAEIDILFIPNPNQPIEDNFSLKELKKISKLCSKKKILLVVDEAYHMFGSETAASLCRSLKNIIVLRTFSKSFGLPSIRFGYVIAHKEIIEIFNTYRLSYESNLLSDKVVEYFIKNKKEINNYIEKVKKGRDYLKRELKKIKIEVIGGKSNFLLINFKDKNLLKKILKKFSLKKIYVKSNYQGDLQTCILITCGYVKTMKKVLEIIRSEVTK